MKTGDAVRIVEDEFPELVGATGALERFGPDGTTAWVNLEFGPGLWCSVSALEKVESS